MDVEQANPGGVGPFLALLRRELREDWPFLLAAVALLACAAPVPRDMALRPVALPAVLLAVAVGLGLGVRAFAPDSANGTARFLAALPVSGKLVLAAKLAVRVAAILLGTAIGTRLAADGAAWVSSTLGAGALFACLVGVVAGQLLDRPATAFAAGAATLVMLARLTMQLLFAGAPNAHLIRGSVLMIIAMSLLSVALLGVARWLVSRR